MRDISWRMILSDEMNRRAARRKRSAKKLNEGISISKENQRSFLLRIRLGAPNISTTSGAGPIRKIVTADYEYEDPYWNIKNTKLTQHDYVETDYDEDFASELPRPGKLGSYPKQSGGPSPFEWASSNGNIKQKGNGRNRDSYKGYDQGPVVDDRSGNERLTWA
ncbi:hypothetical protein EVAR_12802_1 [Eumeta japonica]|uniref:Uncharacterized protein n=1 Tax=Eumeta variegata TaxID=151549 RepID=A0A4C1UAV0_EUMVA|nr:hypothetical protein EVAR_12802_1 [Eumeta japonica]